MREQRTSPRTMWAINCTVLVWAESLDEANDCYETMVDALPVDSVDFAGSTICPVPEDES